ncbi:hypothetical protein ACWD64_18570 [Streptomyces antibioticus]
MTEVSTEPVAIQAAPTTPPPPPGAPPAPTPAVSEVDHTPGGWPVVPLALSGANTTVGMVAAASLAGGPIAAAVAATGMAVLGVAAASRNRKPNPRRDARRAAARHAGHAAARRATSTNGNRTGSRGARSAAGARRAASQHRRGSAPTSRHSTAGAKSGRAASGGSPKSMTAARSVLGSSKAAGRVGQIRALRAAQQSAAGSRAERRGQTTAARRAVADARRNAHTLGGKSRTNTAPSNGRSGGKGSLAGRLLGGSARKARAGRDAAVAKNRARRDAKTAGTVATQRAAVRKAPARKAARQALRRSAARFHGRRLLAALLALPVGLLGCLTTPLGRKFNIPWLMNPGRRLYRRLVRTAAEQRAERDETTRKTLREQEAAADAEAAKDGTEGIADGVERPAATVPTSTTPQVSEGEHVSGFRFEEVASEMEQAANQYDPENAMEILAMVEGLPAALTSVANVMKILAERSDSEFPLEKEVADGFNDIFGALMSAVAVAEDMGPLFRQAHEQDIARHEDPRNGTEAEKGWNV